MSSKNSKKSKVSFKERFVRSLEDYVLIRLLFLVVWFCIMGTTCVLLVRFLGDTLDRKGVMPFVFAVCILVFMGFATIKCLSIYIDAMWNGRIRQKHREELAQSAREEWDKMKEKEWRESYERVFQKQETEND